MNKYSSALLVLLLLAGGALGAANIDSALSQKYFDTASVQYLTGDLPAALENANLALKFNPKNAGALKLRQSIQREITMSLVASPEEEAKGAAGAVEAIKFNEAGAHFLLLTGSLFAGFAGLFLIILFVRNVTLTGRRAAEEYYCPGCGQRLASSSEPCPNCGNNMGRKMWASISSEQLLWYRKMNWRENPFTLNIRQDLFTGYDKEVKEVLEKISARSGHVLIIGPLGIGKTSMLRWLATQLPKKEFLPIYVSRPPLDFNELVRHIYETLGASTSEARREIDLYNLNKLRRKINKNLIILMDEAHEFTIEVERPLRTLGDIEGVNLVMAGLPETIDKLKTEIQPLYERLVLTVTLDHMSFDETKEMIKVRIESVKGKGTHPFTAAALNKIYEITSGNPRATIKVCDAAVARAIAQGEEIIGPDFIKEVERAEQR